MFASLFMTRVVPVGLCMTLAMLGGCVRPDGRALQKLACEHVASTIDVQSVGQLDALRKALGVAPGVDPLQTCRDLGVTMDSGSPKGETSEPGPGHAGQTGGSEHDQRDGGDAENEGNHRQN